MLQFVLKGLVVPKARPKFNQGQAYLPENYRIWQEKAIIELIEQKQKTTMKYPIKTSIKLHITYKGHANADADNIAGAIMDVLQQAKIIQNDNLKYIQELKLEFSKTTKKQAETLIQISELKPYQKEIL